VPSRRLFVALEPPEAVRRRLAAVANEIRRAAGKAAGEVRWVADENLHLTLQFLGAVPEERVAAIEEAITAAAAQARPLFLEVKGAGGFPNARRPRVVWLGLSGELAELGEVARDLGRRLSPLGFSPDPRPFSAHLTLGRAKENAGAPGLGGALAAAAIGQGISFRAAELVLFESHLSPRGPRYDAILRAPLCG
jgi:2'-5' RNA ligase